MQPGPEEQAHRATSRTSPYTPPFRAEGGDRKRKCPPCGTHAKCRFDTTKTTGLCWGVCCRAEMGVKASCRGDGGLPGVRVRPKVAHTTGALVNVSQAETHP